jgi:plastocyanin domain-containing protein
MKSTIISIVVAALLIGGALLLSRGGGASVPAEGANVKIVDGQQIVTITAKGGYQPRRSVAKAGLPTVLRFDTNGTFDCSLAVIIPSLKFSQVLPQSGQTDVPVGTPEAGTLQGSCGMGMYRFDVVFKA